MLSWVLSEEPPSSTAGPLAPKMAHRGLGKKTGNGRPPRYFALAGVYREIHQPESHEPWDGDNDPLGEMALLSVWASLERLTEEDDDRAAMFACGVVEPHVDETRTCIHVNLSGVRVGHEAWSFEDLLEMNDEDLLQFGQELGLDIDRREDRATGELFLVVQCDADSVIHFRLRSRSRVCACQYLCLRRATEKRMALKFAF